MLYNCFLNAEINQTSLSQISIKCKSFNWAMKNIRSLCHLSKHLWPSWEVGCLFCIQIKIGTEVLIHASGESASNICLGKPFCYWNFLEPYSELVLSKCLIVWNSNMCFYIHTEGPGLLMLYHNWNEDASCQIHLCRCHSEKVKWVT